MDPTAPAMRLQAELDNRTLDLAIEDGVVTIDGAPLAVRAHHLSERTVHLLVDGRSYVMTVEQVDERHVRVTHRGRSQVVLLKTERDLLLERMGIDAQAGSGVSELRAPMPGLVLQVLVEAGGEVAEGTGLVVLEAMKMENELRATAPATVAQVHVAPGQAVGKNELLVSFEV